MGKISLPSDLKNQVVTSVREKHQITDEIEELAESAKRREAWITAAVFLVGMIAFYYQWGGEALFVFFMPILPPMVSWVVISGAVSLMSRGPVPQYIDYEADLKKELEKTTNEFNEWIRTKADYWKGLSGLDFERELAKLLEKSGFRVELTKASADGGVDIVAWAQGRRIAVQCKRYKKKVGVGAIRELYGVVQADGYDMGILAVTSDVTKGVSDFVEGKPLKVMGLDSILSMQMKTTEGV